MQATDRCQSLKAPYIGEHCSPQSEVGSFLAWTQRMSEDGVTGSTRPIAAFVAVGLLLQGVWRLRVCFFSQAVLQENHQDKSVFN